MAALASACRKVNKSTNSSKNLVVLRVLSTCSLWLSGSVSVGTSERNGLFCSGGIIMQALEGVGAQNENTVPRKSELLPLIVGITSLIYDGHLVFAKLFFVEFA